MKVLHTGDWHLGKRLDFYSRLAEQEEAMDEICLIVDSNNVDVILIAGDLFDTFNPPVEAVELFYKTLKKLSDDGRRAVIAIAGNHDSPNRIDAPVPLARTSGIILIGHPKATVTPFEIENNFKIQNSAPGFVEIKFDSYEYPLRLIHTAYANEVRLRQYLDIDDKENKLTDALSQHWRDLADTYCDAQGVNILMTHLYMLKRNEELLDEPDGEKPLRLGNADLIYSDYIPSQIQYTALGHLHRFIPLGKGESVINYSGSPLPYSFSEAGQQKQVLIVDLKPAQKPTVERINLKSGRRLERVKFDSIPKAEEWLLENPDTLVELSIESDDYLSAQDISILRKAHDGIIHMIPIVKSRQHKLDQRREVNLNDDIENIFIEYFKSKTGQSPNDDIMDLFKQLI